MREILNAIKESFYILDLEEDWDGDGASPVKLESYLRALEFLSEIALKIQNLYPPYIAALRDGDVDIMFDNPKNGHSLLIRVSPEKKFCYGAGRNRENEISEQIIITDDVIQWLSKHMTNEG